MPIVIVIDDEPEVLKAVTRCLIRLPIDIQAFSSAVCALEFMTDNQPHLVICDNRMPFMDGLTCLAKIQKNYPNVVKVMLSAYQEFDTVVEGINQGIINKFIAKPWKNAELVELVEDVLEHENDTDNEVVGMLGESDAMKSLMEQIKLSAGANVPIFIHGETGTGKELVAKACHQLSHRRQGEFVAVNCANFSENLIESQLFGHKKGAFTGAVQNQKGWLEQSHGGTLFLDEITTLPISLQARLLRVIQEREFTPVGGVQSQSFDTQIISASSQSLQSVVAAGTFREDLFYRLNVLPLNLPPLRERGNDVLLLAEHFLKVFSTQQQKNITGFSRDAKQFFSSYVWPGNVRQLENTIHGLVILSQEKVITKSLLDTLVSDATSPKVQSTGQVNKLSHERAADSLNVPEQTATLEEIERQAIEQAIANANGNISKAASALAVNPSTIYRKMQKWQNHSK